jgi:hypothetical protein
MFGGLSVLLYKPWRRYVNLHRPAGVRRGLEHAVVDEENSQGLEQGLTEEGVAIGSNYK